MVRAAMLGAVDGTSGMETFKALLKWVTEQGREFLIDNRDEIERVGVEVIDKIGLNFLVAKVAKRAWDSLLDTFVCPDAD